MGNRLRNIAAAKPVDGVSTKAPHSGRAQTRRRQKKLCCHPTHSTVATHARRGSNVKRHSHRVLVLMTIDVDGLLSNKLTIVLAISAARGRLVVVEMADSVSSTLFY
jgi:hypothetical protein